VRTALNSNVKMSTPEIVRMSVILSDWDRVPTEPLFFVVCSMPTTVEGPFHYQARSLASRDPMPKIGNACSFPALLPKSCPAALQPGTHPKSARQSVSLVRKSAAAVMRATFAPIIGCFNVTT
jgi:hypothetical protein